MPRVLLTRGNGKVITGWYWDSRRYEGNVFYGNWVDDKKDGKGKVTYSNGDIYDGDWSKNNIQGTGMFIYANGDKYDGEWINSQRNGKGTFTSNAGEKYIGEWKDDIRTGQGTFTDNQGNKYKGEWNRNIMNGQGHLLIFLVIDIQVNGLMVKEKGKVHTLSLVRKRMKQFPMILFISKDALCW